MGSEVEDPSAASIVGIGGRKPCWGRSASLSPAASSSAFEKISGVVPPATPRSKSCRSRFSLLPLQPLSISRRSHGEWPSAGSDDVRTPNNRPGGEECSKVSGHHILIGGGSVARDREILRENAVTHVLNCAGSACPEYFDPDLAYKTLWLQDSPAEDITSVLYDVFDYLEDVREQRGRVLVHCCRGISRSASLVIAYLMWKEGRSFDDAFAVVRAARGVANPNVGFACQLLQLQKRIHGAPPSPSSMMRMYRMAPHSPCDPLHLVPKLLNDPSPAALDSRGAFVVQVLSAIYVWIGEHCEASMERDAKAAAFQAARYEKASGMVVFVLDGLEPEEFWEAFSSSRVQIPSGNAQVEYVLKIGAGNRRVESYDQDFQIFSKSITGGSGRESNWSILKWKFLSRALSGAYPDPLPVKDSNNSRNLLLDIDLSATPPCPSPSSISSDSSTSSNDSSESPALLTSAYSSQHRRSSLGSEPVGPCLSEVCSPPKGLAPKSPSLTEEASVLPRSSTNALLVDRCAIDCLNSSFERLGSCSSHGDELILVHGSTGTNHACSVASHPSQPLV